jgi:uncharacterized protein (TIGR00369 family)
MEIQNPNYRKSVEAIVTGCPFIQYLNLELRDLGPGWCESYLKIRKHHLQQNNFVHSGVLATIADHTAGMASLSLVPENQIVLTIAFTIKILRPAIGEAIRCKATVLKFGKTITVTESEVFAIEAGEEKLVAKASVTIANVNQTK